MLERLENIRIGYDEDLMQVLVYLDESICKKRLSLLESIISQVEGILLEQKKSQTINQYLIYASSLRQTWDHLKKTPEKAFVKVLAGSGIPRLRGMRIAEPSAKSPFARLFLPQDPSLLKSWHWQWVYCAIKMAFLQFKIDYEASPAEVRHYLSLAIAGNPEGEEFYLHPRPKAESLEHALPSHPSWYLRLGPNRQWVELLVHSKTALTDERLAIKVCLEAQKMLGLMRSNHYMSNILVSDLHNELAASREGIPSLGLGFPLSFLVATQYPTLPFKNEDLAIQSVFKQARNSLQIDPRLERLFVCAHLGLSQAILGQLTQRLTQLVERLSLLRRETRGGLRAKDYFLAISLFPFTDKRAAQPSKSSLPQISSHTWLIWVIREMVKFEDFQLDAKWIAKRLVFPASLSQIEQTLKMMIDKRLLIFDHSRGRYEQATEILMTTTELTGQAIAKHYEDMFTLTPDFLVQTESSKKMFRIIKLSLKPNEFKRLRDFISRFSQDLLKIEKQVVCSEDIFHLGFLFFPEQSAESVPARSA